MATAAATATAEPTTDTPTMTPQTPRGNPPSSLTPLWPRGIQIPFIGVTGEFGVGKTLFGLLIDPGRCVHFDFEQSAKTYESGLPFTRIDMQELARSKFTNGRYRSLDLFTLWREKFQSMPKGRFRVAVIDDVSSLEDGLFDYVRKNPGEFGYTAAQFAKSEPMVWGAGKAHYKSLMLSAGIECCVMVSHMRAQFSGNRPTGKREAKGKETVMELASLYLMLDRKPDEKGKVPAKPNAVKLKDRLSVFIVDPQTGEYEPKPVLPPRITACTPERIRWYINNPPDYSKLKKDELALPEQMTDDERLMAQIQLATEQKEAAQAQAMNQVAVNEAAKIRVAAMHAAPGAVAVDQSAAVNQATEDKTEAAAETTSEAASEAAAGSIQPDSESSASGSEPAAAEAATQQESPVQPASSVTDLDSTPPAVPMVTDEQRQQMLAYVKQLGWDADSYAKWKEALKRFNVKAAKELTFDAADKLLAALERKTQTNAKSQGLNEWANQAAGITAPAPATEAANGIAQTAPFDVPANQPA